MPMPVDTPNPSFDAAGELPGGADATLSACIDLARTAAREVAGVDLVGEHLGVSAEGERVATHYFASLAKGYPGWRWAVTLARVPRAASTTISEISLLPGPDSVVAPPWLPWADRIAPGDLGPSDHLAYRDDDPNLEPGYQLTGEADADQMAQWELGLGRVRVLSAEGRNDIARRWYTSDRGPTGDEALHAEAACSTCGYFLPLSGSLRQVFGVCGNAWSPSDARVVTVDHGCGAHSETDLGPSSTMVVPPLILDETGYDALVIAARSDEIAADEIAAEAVDVELLELELPEVELVEVEPVEAELVEVEPVEAELVEAELADVQGLPEPEPQPEPEPGRDPED